MEEPNSISGVLDKTTPKIEENEFLYDKPELKEGDRVIVYLRKSLDKEDIEPMRRAMDEFVARLKLVIVPRNEIELYFVETKTGTVDDSRRPIFKAAIDACKDNDIKAVLAPDASRYSREGPRYGLNI